MTAPSNMKSTASAMNFLKFFNWWSRVCAKTERCCFVSFFTHQVFHSLWKTPWKTKKHRICLIFLIVEKSFAFQQSFYLFSFLKDKKKDFFEKSDLKFPFFQSIFLFPKVFHIFYFSTSHLFKKFHKNASLKKFYTKSKKFSALFPIKKTTSHPSKNPEYSLLFRAFPNFPRNLKQILLNNNIFLIFFSEKTKIRFSVHVETEIYPYVFNHPTNISLPLTKGLLSNESNF